MTLLQVNWPSRRQTRRLLPTRHPWVAAATDRQAAEGIPTRAHRRWTVNFPSHNCPAAAVAAWWPAVALSPCPPTAITTSRTYNTARYRIRSTCQLTITIRRIINRFSFFRFDCLFVCLFFSVLFYFVFFICTF